MLYIEIPSAFELLLIITSCVTLAHLCFWSSRKYLMCLFQHFNQNLYEIHGFMPRI
jgi:hypothetical protein